MAKYKKHFIHPLSHNKTLCGKIFHTEPRLIQFGADLAFSREDVNCGICSKMLPMLSPAVDFNIERLFTGA